MQTLLLQFVLLQLEFLLQLVHAFVLSQQQLDTTGRNIISFMQRTTSTGLRWEVLKFGMNYYLKRELLVAAAKRFKGAIQVY